jgi:hypothetical protein
MKPLQVQDVVELLCREIDRVGGQTQWARQTGVQRDLINKVLSGRRLPTSCLCRALGMEWVLARQISQRDGGTKSVIIKNRDLFRILREAINEAGSVSAWSRQIA